MLFIYKTNGVFVFRIEPPKIILRYDGACHPFFLIVFNRCVMFLGSL